MILVVFENHKLGEKQSLVKENMTERALLEIVVKLTGFIKRFGRGP